MARGYPDYNNPLYNIAARNLDLSSALLAMRGIQSVDGLGRMVYATTFADGLNDWKQYASGAAPVWYASGVEPEIAPVCASTTTAPPTYASVAMWHHNALSDYTGIGVQLSVQHAANLAQLQVEIQLWSSDGVYIRENLYKLLVRPANSDIQYKNSHTSYTTVASLDRMTGYTHWNTIKMVIDPATQTFVRLRVNNQTYAPNIQDNSALVIPPAIVLLGITAITPDSTARSQSVGHVLITYDEPI